MSRPTFNKVILLALAISLASLTSYSQTYTSYAPYSFYGIGDLMTPGTAYNKSMGGVGIANRNNRFLNTLNPASVTARDSLSFMADFSVLSENKTFEQGTMQSAVNTFNINDLLISFPIWRSSAMMLGIVPVSGTGFGYTSEYLDDEIIGRTGSVSYTATGKGGLYNAFAAAGVTFFKRISLGVQFNVIFGNTTKDFYETFSESSFNGAKNGYDMNLSTTSWKFGLQYEQPLGHSSSITLGGTYNLRTQLGGTVTGYKFSSGSAATDTLYYKELDLKSEAEVYLASELGVGIGVKIRDRIMVEFDYSRSDWRNSGFDNTMGFMGNTRTTAKLSKFQSSVAENYRLGFEYVPNRSDIRYYFKKCSYRAGAYYKKDYFVFDGYPIYSMGITLGATFPIFFGYNGLTVGLELGQRGALQDNMMRDRYFNICVGMNIFDIWFRRTQYE